MLPYILAAVGGYLIGDSIGDDGMYKRMNTMANGGWIDEVTRDMNEIKKKFPNSKVSYYFAKNHNGKNYVIEAKENGKVVYTSYQQNKMADGGMMAKGGNEAEQIASTIEFNNFEDGEDIDYADSRWF
jgi:hypothetical protein